MTVEENTLQAIDAVRVGVPIARGYTPSVAIKDGPPRTVGANVAAIRTKLGWSQVRLADALKMRQPSLWKIENSPALPETATLFKLADALGCSIEQLLEGVDKDYDLRRTSADKAHEKKTESPTNAKTDPGVQQGDLVWKSYEVAPRGSVDAKAAAVRSPLTIAALLKEQAAHLQRTADTLNHLASQLARSTAQSISLRPQRVPVHSAHPPRLRKRTAGQRGKS